MEHVRPSFLIVILAVVIFSGCQQDNQQFYQHRLSSQNWQRPDTKMEKVRVFSYGETGLEWELKSPFAQVFSKVHRMMGNDVKVRFYEHGVASTDVSSDRGVISNGISDSSHRIPKPAQVPISLNPGDVYMSGHVVAVSTEGSKLTTDWVHFEKDKALIVSTAPVQVVRRDSVTHGKGFTANENFSSIKIYNQTVVFKDEPEDSSKHTK